ncbi:MAG: hypothetical protein CK526_06640 [Thaumarchaeota archaeon]|nr:MAG: hypothetical protein CK526_06640 [Nitrososphaerota archaeon]
MSDNDKKVHVIPRDTDVQKIKQADSVNQNDASTWNNKGNALRKLGKHEEAIICYDESLKIDPKYVGLKMSVENKLKNLYNALEFTKNKQFQSALDCYNKILKTTPNDVETLYKKSIALENLCKYDKAVQCYDVILKIKPDHTDVLHSKGQVLAKLGQYDKAIECYDTILKINSEDTNALYTKGNALFEERQYDKAIECYNKVLKIKPEDINALFNKGNALFELGQSDKSLKCFDRPFKKNPPLCSISPGYPVYCPKCNSSRVLIFYDFRFTPRLQNKWDELIYGKRISLENRWEKIKDENQWGKLKKGTEKPNWICKDCYDGGIILEYLIDKKSKN